MKINLEGLWLKTAQLSIYFNEIQNNLIIVIHTKCKCLDAQIILKSERNLSILRVKSEHKIKNKKKD